ncbi:MAG TPA: isochorismatase family cysteine hydrolase [Pseudomonadales bacterium]|nr:isochorismatase family cysteine hydrolase [Pseudomonadales bacterium]
MNKTDIMRAGRRKEKYNIDFRKTALLVIDMVKGQYDGDSMLMNHYRNLDKELPDWFLNRVQTTIIPTIQKTLKLFREKQALVIHSKYCTLMQNYSDLPVMCQLGNMIYEKPIIASPESQDSDFEPTLMPLDNEPVIIKSACSSFEGTALEKILRRNGIETLVITGIFTNMCVTGTARSAFDKGFDSLVISDACGDITQELHESALAGLEVLFSDICEFKQITV